MDAAAFDRLSRTLGLPATAAPPRYPPHHGGASWVSAGTTGHRPGACQANGTRCNDGNECCSGRCKREQRGKHGTCRRADNQGECTIEQNACSSRAASPAAPTAAWPLPLLRDDHRPQLLRQTGAVNARGNCGCNEQQECEQRLGKGAKCVQAGRSRYAASAASMAPAAWRHARTWIRSRSAG